MVLRAAALSALRWVLGVVILLESVRVVVFSDAAEHVGLPPWILVVLGSSEILAAGLFLMPITSRVGGLLIDSMAVIVCLTARKPAPSE